MGSRVMIVVEIGCQGPAERGFTEGDDVIQALPANRADDALDVGSLPRRSGCGEHFLNTQSDNLVGEGVSVDRIAVAQQVARRGDAPEPGRRKGLGTDSWAR